jgi:hypothetical protein
MEEVDEPVAFDVGDPVVEDNHWKLCVANGVIFA